MLTPYFVQKWAYKKFRYYGFIWVEIDVFGGVLS